MSEPGRAAASPPWPGGLRPPCLLLPLVGLDHRLLDELDEVAAALLAAQLGGLLVGQGALAVVEDGDLLHRAVEDAPAGAEARRLLLLARAGGRLLAFLGRRFSRAAGAQLGRLGHPAQFLAVKGPTACHGGAAFWLGGGEVGHLREGPMFLCYPRPAGAARGPPRRRKFSVRAVPGARGEVECHVLGVSRTWHWPGCIRTSPPVALCKPRGLIFRGSCGASPPRRGGCTPRLFSEEALNRSEE